MMQTQILFNKKLNTKHYSNGQLGVFVQEHNGEPIAELSIMNDSTDLGSDEFILKDYSENEKIIKEYFIQKKIIPTNKFVLIGSHLCSVCQLRSVI
ncbi:MAG: hypothetical protein ACXADU_08960 [Promethearchaeota archaeon]